LEVLISLKEGGENYIVSQLATFELIFVQKRLGVNGEETISEFC
jgi:hypothetical protein